MIDSPSDAENRLAEDDDVDSWASVTLYAPTFTSTRISFEPPATMPLTVRAAVPAKRTMSPLPGDRLSTLADRATFVSMDE
jgi:hypothetical protein